MARITCLAGIDPERTAMLTTLLQAVGLRAEAVSGVDVAELGRLSPTLLICDIDGLASDPLELLRQLRFVLPACVIGVYTSNPKRSWSVACHLAGANGLFSKASSASELAAGIRGARRVGCFTDPRFTALG